jgi:hypothetical protein
MMSVWLSPVNFSTSRHEIWHERYAAMEDPNLVLHKVLQSTTTLFRTQTCEVGGTLAPLKCYNLV